MAFLVRLASVKLHALSQAPLAFWLALGLSSRPLEQSLSLCFARVDDQTRPDQACRPATSRADQTRAAVQALASRSRTLFAHLVGESRHYREADFQTRRDSREQTSRPDPSSPAGPRCRADPAQYLSLAGVWLEHLLRAILGVYLVIGSASGFFAHLVLWCGSGLFAHLIRADLFREPDLQSRPAWHGPLKDQNAVPPRA